MTTISYEYQIGLELHISEHNGKV